MRFFVIIFLLLFSVANIIADSQPPPPSKTNVGSQKQEDTRHINYTAHALKETPTPHSVIAVETRNPEAQITKHQKDDKMPSEWWLIGLTAILSLATTWLVIETRRLVAETALTSKRQAAETKDTLEISRQAAKAAQDSAAGLTMIERAYVFAAIRMEEWKIVVDLKNHGKTPAILKSMFVTRKFHPTPPQEIDTRQKSMIRDGVVIGSDIVWPVALSPWLDDSERQMLDRPDFKLFCFGVIEYLDVLNQRRTTGFCWQYNYQYGVGEWSIADSELNYYDRDENDNKPHIPPKV